MNRRDARILALLGIAAIAAVVVRLFGVGPALDAAVSDDARSQIYSLRLLRVGAGASVGACLAVAGVMLQSLMRNPLASPDLMGMSAGAGLAVLLSRAIGASLGAAGVGGITAGLAFGAAWDVLPALVGAFSTLAVVFSLSHRRGLLDPTWLVLVGVMISILCGAGIMLLQHLVPGVASAGGAGRVLVGALSDETTRAQVGLVAFVALLGLAVGLFFGPAMDAGALGDHEAFSVGVPLRRLRTCLLLTAGLLTAAAVALAGPLGFVGLICPHAVRVLAARRNTHQLDPRSIVPGWWGSHRVRTIGSALAGITLVVGGDALVSALRDAHDSIGRLPLGVVMAFLGAPAFVLLLRRTPRSSSLTE